MNPPEPALLAVLDGPNPRSFCKLYTKCGGMGNRGERMKSKYPPEVPIPFTHWPPQL